MAENRKSAREYFEKGCLCIINNKIDKQPDTVADNKAATYYENNCTCSRNYRPLETES